mgnify:FL=1
MNGILLIDKAEGWTSSDVVIKLKGVLRERRVGHSGTLDPMATGLLAVFVGRATRAVEFAEAHDKRYTAGLRLGVTTDTQDVTGSVLRSCQANVAEDELKAVLTRFTGELEQIPPMYSAIKINGQKLYDIARRGGEVERRPRHITVSGISVVGRSGNDFVLDISCSKGTYIRTLCNDIGDALGCGGCMSSLRRTAAGDFSVSQAYTIDEVVAAAAAGEAGKLLLPTDSMFAALPRCTAGAQDERRIKNGNEIKTPALADGDYRVYSDSGEFLMLGRAENGRMRTIKSFFEV